MKYSFLPVVIACVVSTVVPTMAQTTAPTPNTEKAATQSAAPLAEWSKEWQGPLPLQNERPLQAIFLHLPAQNPDVLVRGATRLGLQLDIANDLLIPAVGANGASVTEDFETQRLKINWSKGFGRDMEYGIGANITARNGGFLDGAVEGVHELFNTEGEAFSAPIGRKNLPRGRSILAFQNAAGQGISEGSAFGLGDTTLWLKKQLSRNDKFSTAASVALKLPTGSEGHVTGSGGFDVGIAVDARYRLARRFALFGNLGVAKYGNSSIPGAADNGMWGAIGYEWKVGRKDSVIGQVNYEKRGVTTNNEFADRKPVIASIGYKKRVSPKRAYWLAIGENGDFRNYKLKNFFNIGPDITLNFGYEFQR